MVSKEREKKGWREKTKRKGMEGRRGGGGEAVKSRQFAIEFASDFPPARSLVSPRRCGTETTWVNLCENLSSCLWVKGRKEACPSLIPFQSRGETTGLPLPWLS